MSKPIFSDEALLDWLKAKKPDTEYNFNCQQCAIGSYLKEHGFSYTLISPTNIYLRPALKDPIRIPVSWRYAVSGSITGHPRGYNRTNLDGAGYWVSSYGEAAGRLERWMAGGT